MAAAISNCDGIVMITRLIFNVSWQNQENMLRKRGGVSGSVILPLQRSDELDHRDCAIALRLQARFVQSCG